MLHALACDWFAPRCSILLTLLMVGGLFSLAHLAAPSAAVAQEEQKKVEEGDTAPAPSTDSTAPKKKESYLMWIFNALGWRYTIAFLAISFTFVALIVMITLSLQRSAVAPPELVEGFEAQLNERQYQAAYELAKNDESFLGHVLSAGLQRVEKGYDHAIEAMQEVGEEETMRLEHRLSYVAMVGAIAPMVGLLGTVDGMVIAFSKIAESPTTPKPSELAQGISTALVTTLVGLLLAIPAIMFLGVMKNRLARLTLEVGIISEGLMSRFETKK